MILSEPYLIGLIVTAASLGYLFCAGIAHGFACEWITEIHLDAERAILAVLWPAYLVGFIVYRIARTGAAVPKWSASLVRKPKIPAAIIHRER